MISHAVSIRRICWVKDVDLVKGKEKLIRNIC
jgi:hypothetical protein